MSMDPPLADDRGAAPDAAPGRRMGHGLPPLCRPSAWIAEWRRIGAISVLNGRKRA